MVNEVVNCNTYVTDGIGCLWYLGQTDLFLEC